MDCGCLSISLSVGCALKCTEVAPRPTQSTQRGGDSTLWLARRGVRQGSLLMFDQLIDLSTGVAGCVPEFNFRIHFWEVCLYRNDEVSHIRVEEGEGETKLIFRFLSFNSCCEFLVLFPILTQILIRTVDALFNLFGESSAFFSIIFIPSSWLVHFVAAWLLLFNLSH